MLKRSFNIRQKCFYFFILGTISYWFIPFFPVLQDRHIPAAVKEIISNEDIEKVMKQRSDIRKHGCQYLDVIWNAMDNNYDYSKLIEIHRNIFNLKKPEIDFERRKCRSGKNSDTTLSTTNLIKLVDAPFNIAMCLPPKETARKL